MEITFFGARGSCPCAGERYHRYGGNTSSVLLRTASGELIVLDLGTGVRALGARISSEHPAGSLPVRATVLLSHLHFDHICGLPFFAPLRHEDSFLDIYGPRQSEGSLAEALGELVRPPYFPVTLQALLAELRFHDLSDGDDFVVGDAKVHARSVRHLGTTLGYRIDADGCSVAYVPDHQESGDGSSFDDGVLELCDQADLLVHDAQYTDFELLHKPHWGHSTVDFAVELAKAARAAHLVLFHHDPSHDDRALDDMLSAAELLAGPHGIKVSSAREGDTLALGH